jgi:predicted DNA binding protein
VFHAAEFETLQQVMGELRERYPPVDVRRLLQPPLDGTPEERVFVNRARLTDRQLEALTTAAELGYFERPRQANASEVAAELDITQSTFTEHLVTAQRKLLDDILE